MDLSRNRFGERAGLELGPAISENSSIKYLDLSWNSIRKKGAVAVAQGIKVTDLTVACLCIIKLVLWLLLFGCCFAVVLMRYIMINGDLNVSLRVTAVA